MSVMNTFFLLWEQLMKLVSGILTLIKESLAQLIPTSLKSTHSSFLQCLLLGVGQICYGHCSFLN